MMSNFVYGKYYCDHRYYLRDWYRVIPGAETIVPIWYDAFEKSEFYCANGIVSAKTLGQLVPIIWYTQCMMLIVSSNRSIIKLFSGIMVLLTQTLIQSTQGSDPHPNYAYKSSPEGVILGVIFVVSDSIEYFWLLINSRCFGMLFHGETRLRTTTNGGNAKGLANDYYRFINNMFLNMYQPQPP